MAYFRVGFYMMGSHIADPGQEAHFEEVGAADSQEALTTVQEDYLDPQKGFYSWERGGVVFTVPKANILGFTVTPIRLEDLTPADR
jgi:hypothetical protein